MNNTRDFLHWFTMYYLGQFDHFYVKRNLQNFSRIVDFGNFFLFCVDLAKCFIIRGIYFGIYCSISKLSAMSTRMPNFLCNKLRTCVLISCTNLALLWLLTL